jgi:hypothetical protein
MEVDGEKEKKGLGLVMVAVKGGDGGAHKVEDDEKRGLRQRRWVKKRTGRALEANHTTASKKFSIQTVTCVPAYFVCPGSM